ncbi:MAG: serine hydrolase [Isosphaeraceae bacterium]|nr:serine hydrolase [Isosphaeraceae bacterium]
MNGQATENPRVPPWAWIALVLILLFDVWYRCHTIGPTIKNRLGLTLYPTVVGEAEPLDCDEAAYAYIGRRLVRGDVLYRDLTENKPPGGYWLYALAVAIGGAEEATIRLLPIPFALATIALAWWIALRLAGPIAAILAAFVCAIMSTDPYLYGNGAQLEQFINLFSVASLALMVRALPRSEARGTIAAAGAFVGLACLVRQVSFTHLVVYAIALLVRRPSDGADRSLVARLGDLAALAGGCAAVGALAAAVLVARGAGEEAFEDIIRYGGALAIDTPPAPQAPPLWMRWVTGNVDPRSGEPPWPFGQTDWLVWWGAGSWPLWLAAAVGVPVLLVGRSSDAARRLLAAWTLSAWVQVALPRLFWAHYYLLPVPSVAVSVAAILVDAARRTREARRLGRVVGGAIALALAVAVLGTVVIQVRDYLLVPAQRLAVQYKGGGQWIAQRTLGRSIGRRAAAVWDHPRIFIWGAASPLFIYGNLDGASKHFFADPLLLAFAGRDHPLIRPRTEQILADLEARPPELIFLYDHPFPDLAQFVHRHGYRRSRLGPLPPGGPGSDMRGLWVEPSHFEPFENFSTLPGRSPSADRSAEPRAPPASLAPTIHPAHLKGLPGLPPDVVKAIERAVRAKMKAGGIPGMAVAVVADGQFCWTSGFGLADVENGTPATAETVFRFASITKPITAVAVLQLAEQGRLDLDAPIQQYVKSFPVKRWMVTPRMLLGHLGGVRHYRGDEVESTWHYNSVLHTLTIFRDDPLLYEPGTRFEYSTYGYNLLGAAVVEASGMRYSDYVREHIFRPAGMAHARADDVRAIIPRRARGYVRSQSGELRNSALIDPSNRLPGAGLCGTAADLARFAVALQSGVLLRPETVQMMCQSQTTLDDTPTGYGLGFSLSEHEGHREVLHVGAMPGVSALLYLRPDDHSAVALLSNLEKQAAALLDLAREIADALPREL